MWTTFVEGGKGSRGAPSTHACAGRTGRRSKPPPQFGHTFDRTASTQSRQNVHSYEQIIASVALGASGRLQFSHVGRSSSMFALCQGAFPHRSTRREDAGSPRPCAPSNGRTLAGAELVPGWQRWLCLVGIAGRTLGGILVETPGDIGSSGGDRVAERVRVREISNQEGNRLLRIVRRSTGSVVTWRRAQMVLLSAQGVDVAEIAQVTFTSPDRVRDVLHNFNLDGVRLAVATLPRRPPADFHPGAAPPDQAARPIASPGPRPAVLHLVIDEAGRVPGR